MAGTAVGTNGRGVFAVPGHVVTLTKYFFHHRVCLRSSRSFPLTLKGSGAGPPGYGGQIKRSFQW